MKHRVLLKRAMAFVLTVTMLTSMCTTGYAADVGGSMEVQGTDGTSGAGMLYDSDEDEGVRRGGDSEVQDDQKSGAQDNENDNTDEDTGKNSDGQDEKAGEAEDASGKESGKNQGGDSDNQKPSQGDSGDTTGNVGENSGDENKNQGGNSSDKNQAPEEGSGDQTQTSGSNSDDKSQDSGANQGDPKDTDGSTDSADTNQGNNQGTVSNQETDSNGSLNDKKNPNKTQNNTGANTDKTQDGKDEERVIVSPEEFLTEYEAFLEKYKADQENISKGKKPVEFKTWKEVKAPIARILDMADGLEDPDPMEEQIQELREIFTNEGSKEFVRLVVRLMNDLINGEDEEDEELLENEDLEAIILDGPANEFSQLIDELIQDMSEKSEDEAGKDGSSDDSLGTGTDGAGADEDAEERGQAASAENADSDGNSDGKDVLESADKAAKTENDTKTAENTEDEELDEELTSGPVAEFFHDVNNLIYDMVVVLADEETALSGKELREALSKSRVIADFVLGVSGVLQDLKDGLDFVLLDDVNKEEELEQQVIDEAIGQFVSQLNGITDALLEGKYVSDTKEMTSLFQKAINELEEAVPGIFDEYSSDSQTGFSYFVYDFYVFLINYNTDVKVKQDNEETIHESIEEYYRTRMNELQEEVSGVDELSSFSDEVTRIFKNCGEDLSAVLKVQELKNIEDQIANLDTQADEILRRFNEKGYDSLDSLKEELEQVKSAVDIISQNPSETFSEEIKEKLDALPGKLNDLEEKIAGRIAQREQYTQRYTELIKDANIFLEIESEEEGRPVKDWKTLSEDLIGLLEELERVETEEFIFSAEQFEGIRDTLGGLLDEIAWKEYQTKVNTLNANYEGKTVSGLLEELREVEDFRNINLDELGADKEAQLKAIEAELSKTRAKAFTAIANDLIKAAEAGQFKEYTKTLENGTSETYEGYTAYNKFVSDANTAERLLDNGALEHLNKLLEASESESTEAQEISQIITKAEEALDDLEECQQAFSVAVKPEAQKAWALFNREYNKFIGEYEGKENSWKWEDLLKRVTELQKLANGLPKELYMQTSEQQNHLLTILSDKAKTGVQGVIDEVNQWLENMEEDKESAEIISPKIDFAKTLMDYIIANSEETSQEKQEMQKELELLEQKLQLIQNGNTSENVERFVKAVDAFVKMLEDKAFEDEEGKIQAFRLLSEYDKLITYYDALNDVEKELPQVKEKNALLDEEWEKLCEDEKYNNAIVMMQGPLYEFLKAEKELYQYFEEVEESYEGTEEEEKIVTLWSLKLALEECSYLKDGLEKTFSDSGYVLRENIDFLQAETELGEITEWIDSKEKKLTDFGENPVGGLYIVGQALNEGEELSVPEVTTHNAKEFIQLVSTMESALTDIHAMCQRMQELVVKLQNGTLADADRDALKLEIEQLVLEVNRTARHTNYDNWHGLVGGEAYAETAWKIEENKTGIANPMKVVIEPMTVEGLGLDEFSQFIEDDNMESASNKLKEVITTISLTRAELDARQNLSEHIVTAMETWQANEDDISLVPKFTSIGRDKTYDSIDDESVIEDSYDNAVKMITNIQIFEGVLNEHHDMLQCMNELAVKRSNYDEGGVDYQSITLEMQALAEGLTFLSQYVSYDCCNGLTGGTLEVPMGWNEYECHPVKVVIGDMTAKGLKIESESKTYDFDLDTITNAIRSVSRTRSVLGAWQNTAEHIVELCQITLETGPMIGNQFDRYPDGLGKDEKGNPIEGWNWYDHHHIPVKLTGWFDRVYRETCDRIDELEQQMRNGTYSDVDRENIEEEIKQLRYGVDVMIDLLKTDVVTAPYVRLEEDINWQNKVFITENNTEYRYQLVYQSDASGVADVCLIDHVENRDNTVYAGTIIGVDLSGAENVTDALGKHHAIKVYVQTRGIESNPSTEVPEALKKEGGSWELVSDVNNYDKWAYVDSIAFDFGENTFDIADAPVSVEIKMRSAYGKKPGWTDIPEGNEYTLYNTCKVYQNVSDKPDEFMKEADIRTEVTIKYDEEPDLPVQLPTTGGSGTLPFRIAGLAFLVLAETMMFFKKEEDDEMLRGIRG